MPSSSIDHKHAGRAEAARSPASYTAEELMAFQTVAHRLRINLSDIIRVAETRQHDPDARNLSLDRDVYRWMSWIGSPVSTMGLSAQTGNGGSATQYISRTEEEEQKGGGRAGEEEEEGEGNVFDATAQLGLSNSAGSDVAAEEHQGIFQEGTLGLSSMSPISLSNLPFLQGIEPLNIVASAIGEGTIDPQLLSADGKAPGCNPAQIQRPVHQAYDIGMLQPYQDLVLQPFALPVDSSIQAASLQSPVLAPTTNSKLADDPDNTVYDAFHHPAFATDAAAGLAGGVASTDLGYLGFENEYSSHTMARMDAQAPNLPDQPSFSMLTGLDSANQDPATPPSITPTTADIHRAQSRHTKPRRGPKLSAAYWSKSRSAKEKKRLGSLRARHA